MRKRQMEYPMEGISKVEALVKSGKEYEALNQLKSIHFRHKRSHGVESSLDLLYQGLQLFLSPNHGNIQLDLIQLAWSTRGKKLNPNSSDAILDTVMKMLDSATTIVPVSHWDEFLSGIAAELHRVKSPHASKFRMFLFNHFKRFDQGTAARKHCTYLENAMEIGTFIANHALTQVPKYDWDLVIVHTVLHLIKQHRAEDALKSLQTFTELMKEPMSLHCDTSSFPVLLNYANAIAEAVITRSWEQVLSVQHVYSPLIQKRDTNLLTLFENIYKDLFPERPPATFPYNPIATPQQPAAGTHTPSANASGTIPQANAANITRDFDLD